MDPSDLLTIGEVAERAGLATSAIRYYEGRGLVSSVRTTGGQRRFARAVIRRLAFIAAAQRVGRSLDEIVEIGACVATALHDLHRQHLVHLDVKPSSVMQRADGTVVLVDFGLAHHDHLPDLLDEAFPWPMGTGPYMSPEQVQAVRNDPRSDLFALGVMLYHFTTGQRPFGSPETVRGLRRRLVQGPVPPRALRADCPPWLQEIILCCLEPLPDRRWQSGAQLALALRNPADLALTERATRQQGGPWPGRLRAWLASLLPAAPASVSAPVRLLDYSRRRVAVWRGVLGGRAVAPVPDSRRSLPRSPAP